MQIKTKSTSLALWHMHFFVNLYCFVLDTCTCSHLTNVTASVGEMSCTNDETRYCETKQECYATVAFNYGQWDVGCRIVTEN